MNRGRGPGVGLRSVGAEQSSHGHSSGYKWSSTDGSGEKSERRNDNYSGGRKSQTVWKKVQQVPFNASAGQGGSPTNGRDVTDSKVSSPELNHRAETVGGDLMQSERSDLSVDYTKKGSGCSADWSPREKIGNPHANSRPSLQRRTSQHSDNGWVVAPLVPLRKFGLGVSSLELKSEPKTIGKVVMQSENSDVSSDCNVGSSKPGVLDKDSANGLLDLDQSFQLSECSDDGPFDICPPISGSNVVLNEPLSVMNKERRNKIKRAGEPKGTLIRSGMVLLKKFISVEEQANLVKECRKFGLTAGFYQPGYRDGGKLNLRMMCLGMFWDCETKSYSEIRPSDDVKPPPIPKGFIELVDRSIKKSHDLIAQERGSNVRAEDILPSMSPDICLVNFYTASGRLGLHQDRDESKESLRNGLPVVSISIGDSAEFMYGDERDVDKAEKITLESGDVLIFGGESRHVFHGISSVKLNTAPKQLLKNTNLQPGRLNLTFRQYY